MFILAVVLAAVAQYIPANDALQPRTYVSPSGEWKLFVDPSLRDGAGKSTIAISKGGKVQWTGEKPFTFREAVIDDSGISAGYAYSAGEEGGEDDCGALVIAVVAASGETLLVDETPREGDGGGHMPPNPRATRFVLQPDRHVAIACIQGLDSEADDSWMVFQLSPAKKLDLLHGGRELEVPADHQWTFALAAIRGTPLTLAQWCTWGDSDAPDGGPGSAFVLYDEAWKVVWSLPLPGDIDVDDDSLEDELFEQMRSGGGLLDTKTERRFELRQVAKSERVTYEVARDSTTKQGWSVREVARAPFKVEPKKEVELAKLTLPTAGRVEFDVGVQDTSGPVRDIKQFRIDPNGGITFVRGEAVDGTATLVTLDSSGSVLRQVAVAPIEPSLEGMRHWHALEAGDWLVTIQPWDGERPASRTWRVRGQTGAAVGLPAFSGPTIEAIEPTPDGGFVMLGMHSLEYTSQNEVRRCAADGSTLWSHQEYGYGQCENLSDLCSAEDIAVDKDGSVFVLDHSRKLVQIFDGKGVFVRAIELEKSWDSDSSYLTDLVLEPTGTMLIHDIHDVAKWRRVTRDGKELATFTAKHANGSADALGSRDLRVDVPRFWAHNGYQIFEFDLEGVVHARFGSAADPMRLSEVDRSLCDGTGRLALTDRRTRSIHIYTPDGKRAVLCIPDPTAEDRDCDAVITAPDGTIYVQPSGFEDNYLAFEAGGKRMGTVKLGGQRVAFNPRTKERWAAGEGEDDALRLRKFDAEGKLVFETDRRPDGNFFSNICALACAPDGSVVLLDGVSRVLESGPGVLCFFSAKGEPQRQLTVPGTEIDSENFMQVGRRWIVISGYEPTAHVVSLVDGSCRLFEAPDQRMTYSIGLSPDGTELLAVESTVLERFTLPR